LLTVDITVLILLDRLETLDVRAALRSAETELLAALSIKIR
jgi:hypothetical protein